MSAVAVVGAGPAGIAVAAMLRRKGIGAVVLEEGEEPGAAWAWRYDRRQRECGDIVERIDTGPLWDDLSSLTMPLLLARGALSRTNYEFGPPEAAELGFVRVGITPRRSDTMLVVGSILLTDDNADQKAH